MAVAFSSRSSNQRDSLHIVRSACVSLGSKSQGVNSVADIRTGLSGGRRGRPCEPNGSLTCTHRCKQLAALDQFCCGFMHSDER